MRSFVSGSGPVVLNEYQAHLLTCLLPFLGRAMYLTLATVEDFFDNSYCYLRSIISESSVRSEVFNTPVSVVQWHYWKNGQYGRPVPLWPGQ